jgi:hypothetical protein
MSSNVGSGNIYEAGDQRNYKQSELNTAERYNEGKPNSHLPQDSSTWSSHHTQHHYRPVHFVSAPTASDLCPEAFPPCLLDGEEAPPPTRVR